MAKRLAVCLAVLLLLADSVLGQESIVDSSHDNVLADNVPTWSSRVPPGPQAGESVGSPSAAPGSEDAAAPPGELIDTNATDGNSTESELLDSAALIFSPLQSPSGAPDEGTASPPIADSSPAESIPPPSESTSESSSAEGKTIEEQGNGTLVNFGGSVESKTSPPVVIDINGEPVVVSGDTTESSKWAVPIVLVIVLGAAAAGGVWFVRRRRQAVTTYHGLREAEMGTRRDY